MSWRDESEKLFLRAEAAEARAQAAEERVKELEFKLAMEESSHTETIRNDDKVHASLGRRLAALTEQLRIARGALEVVSDIRCRCNSYLGPCGCGDTAIVCADGALERIDRLDADKEQGE